MKKLITVLVFVLAAVSTLTGTAAAEPNDPTASSLRICNVSGSNLGVIHTPDGSYAMGNYDAKLLPNYGGVPPCSDNSFGWPHTGGLWVAPGYEALWYDTHGTLVRTTTGVLPAGTWGWPHNSTATYLVDLCKYNAIGVCVSV